MDLFSQQNDRADLKPLAEQLRPESFEGFFSSKKEDPAFLNLVERLKKGQLFSLILWGPPGSGKTTFAHILSQNTQATFVQEHAVDLGAKKIKELCEEAKSRLLFGGDKTILFVDEIHRLNKSQQDIFLPFIEKGEIYLLGATTENPSYELNRALMSRCRLLVFEPHQKEDLKKLLERALEKEKIVLSEFLTEEAEVLLLDAVSGDARKLLNALEEFIQAYHLKTLDFPLSAQKLKEAGGGGSSISYDKSSEEHYNVISAFIKSIRGSDPDAGVYYLARMLEGGEDPVFIARRLVILASEDIGNADPRAITLAVSTLQAVELVGMPEARISLSQCVCYLASAPKSNASYMAINKALTEVRQSGALSIPKALRSASTALMKKVGYGKGYKYAHDYPKHWVEQNFLPEELKDSKFYEPSSIGFEKRIREYLEWLKG